MAVLDKIVIGDFLTGANVKARPQYNGKVCEVINIAYVADYVGRNYVGDSMLLFVRWPDGANTMHRESSGELRRPTVTEMLDTVAVASIEYARLMRRLV